MEQIVLRAAQLEDAGQGEAAQASRVPRNSRLSSLAASSPVVGPPSVCPSTSVARLASRALRGACPARSKPRAGLHGRGADGAKRRRHGLTPPPTPTTSSARQAHSSPRSRVRPLGHALQSSPAGQGIGGPIARCSPAMILRATTGFTTIVRSRRGPPHVGQTKPSTEKTRFRSSSQLGRSPSNRSRGRRLSRFARRTAAASCVSGRGLGTTSFRQPAFPANTPL